MDHAVRADDQIDLSASALALRGDAPAGQKMGILELVRGPDQFLEQEFAIPSPLYGG